MAQENNLQSTNTGGYFAKLRQGANNMFGGGKPQGQQGNQQQNNNNNQQNDPNDPSKQGQNKNPDNNGNNANGGNSQGDQKSWLEELYTSKNADPEKAPSFSLDEDALGKVVGSQNFTADISDEDIQKLQGGDWGHIKTMMNKVGQGAYKAALQHGSTLTDKYVGARFDHEGKSFDSRVRKNSVNSQLASLPNYDNPAIKSHLNDIADRLASKHPDAPPHEIAQEAQRILMEIANGVNPENTPEARKAKEQAGKTDWDKWLNQDSQNDQY